MLSLIAAMAENRVIGNRGVIPWRIPGEQSRFRELTLGKTILMGRRTFEEIGHPLPDRYTVLISKTKQVETTNCTTVLSLEAAIQRAKQRGEKEIFVAGGAQIYKAALPYADRIYLTVIHQEMEGDTYFPIWEPRQFREVDRRRRDGSIPYTYYIYEKR